MTMTDNIAYDIRRGTTLQCIKISDVFEVINTPN